MFNAGASRSQKSIQEYVTENITTTLTVGNYIIYPFMMIASTAFSYAMSNEQNCGNFSEVFINSGSCNVLKRLLILNSWGLMSMGIITSDLNICFVALGCLMGAGRYAWNRWRTRPNREATSEELAEEGRQLTLEILEKPLLAEEPGSNKPARSLKHANLLDRVNEISWHAMAESKVAMILGGIVGVLIWHHVSRSVLDQYGCTDVNFFELFFFANLFGRLEGRCNPANTYWGMTGFGFAWAFSMVSRLTVWWASVSTQVFLHKTLSDFISPLLKIFSCMNCFSGMRGVGQEAKAELYKMLELGIKLVGIFSISVLVPLAIYDGISFGDHVLEQFACKGLSVLKIVFSGPYATNLMLCSWGMQLLGINAAPTATEVYDLIPIMLLTVLAGSMVGMFINAVQMGKGPATVNCMVRTVEDIYEKGFYASLLFIPVSAWGIYFYAISKANQILQMDPKCSDLSFLTFLWKFIGSDCSVTTVFGAGASYVSDKWIIFINSLMLFYAAGMIGRILQLAVSKCGRSAVGLFKGQTSGSDYYALPRYENEGGLKQA